ncbi:MAG: flagellar basal body rod protein FlgB, partial [Thiohalomonadales bacterium]
DMNNIFGIHQQGMLLRSKRAEILASNLANADTPNFKARDFDFKQTLQRSMQAGNASQMRLTNEKHISSNMQISGMNAELQYRTPMQASIDGNTVNTQIEKAEFAANAVHYQASLQFLTGKIKNIMTAIRGE